MFEFEHLPVSYGSGRQTSYETSTSQAQGREAAPAERAKRDALAAASKAYHDHVGGRGRDVGSDYEAGQGRPGELRRPFLAPTPLPPNPRLVALYGHIWNRR